jgi:hypothetical protein
MRLLHRMLILMLDKCPHTRHLTMDSAVNTELSLNLLTLLVNLSSASGVELRFHPKHVNDESDIRRTSFVGSCNSDGVAISADGTNWHKVQGLTSVEGTSGSYRQFVVDLDAAKTATGLQCNAQFRIRFQQYDNYAITTDGFAFDNIELRQSTAYGTTTTVQNAGTVTAPVAVAQTLSGLTCNSAYSFGWWLAMPGASFRGKPDVRYCAVSRRYGGNTAIR